jgi:hypothetical protein
LQITRTTRLRRTILQLRQIRFTDAITFMSVTFQYLTAETLRRREKFISSAVLASLVQAVLGVPAPPRLFVISP